MTKPPRQFRYTMTDDELRRAISEWAAKHLPGPLVRYEGVVDKQGVKLSGTSGFPNFDIIIEIPE